MVAKINKLYRAFIDYRKVTATDSDLKRERKSYKLIDKELEFFEAIKIDCTIDEDWVEAIEKGLVHVDKAIREDRQFIRSNGEVIDIEKVKNISKDSVEHLARHSTLITRYDEGEDIIPDRLYTVERLSDYAVYENKFLYMHLHITLSLQYIQNMLLIQLILLILISILLPYLFPIYDIILTIFLYAFLCLRH